MKPGRIILALVIVAKLMMLTHTAHAADVGPSGNPLPRFVSLSPEVAYLRTGPGLQYPVAWVYNRRHLPLEIIDEHGAWRQVRDIEGTTGWMHVRLLSSKRSAMLVGKKLELHSDPDAASRVVLTADAGVIGWTRACQGDWCRLEIEGTEGWIERRHLWGVYPEETLE
ncbi:SH3 domain-containing protein [Pseudokordiimonas caeni]|uniref:SH3 domain-containing protein n=1 Tax=Pseudokordiimonas caeni TaxID=2997908 RepID=UPI002812527D|nr:SH3 domain-containing protein [Pseudokordiimonas caeni]